jgi:hypothetical protein
MNLDDREASSTSVFSRLDLRKYREEAPVN